MKRSFLALALVFSVLSVVNASDPVLMKINGKPITKSEFEYIYGKNNNSSSIDKKSLEEYLVLFKNFKLKVIEAESLGIDTTAAFRNELNGYRKQLTLPYLSDNSVEDKLAQEAYERIKKNVDVSHILITVKEDASSADTLAAYKKIMEIRNRLFTQEPTKKGAKAKIVTTCSKERFEQIASEVSEDPSKGENKGHLGWLTSGQTVYPFEIAAYSTPIGKVSMPVRSNYGYHLLLVSGHRPDAGQVLVAHIMKSLRPKADSIKPEDAEATAKMEIEAIYAKLKGGADFGDLATKESDDRGSAPKKGELPWFATNRMIKEFETVAFSLKNKGDFSEPFKTRFGWHVAKLIDKKGIEPLETIKEELVKSFARDERAQAGQAKAVESFKKEYGFSETNSSLQEMINLSKVGFPKDSIYQVIAQTLSAPLFKIGDKSIGQKEFAAFLKNRPVSENKNGEDFIRNNYNEFVKESVLNYEDARLEGKYPEFSNLMKEYHDGMLLFEISNNEVWEKASKDEEGLKKYFEKNRKNYDWTIPRYKGFVVYCKDAATEKKARAMMKKLGADTLATALLKALNDSVTRVKVERVLAAKGENKVIDGKVFKGEKYVPDSKFPFVFIEGKLLEKAPEDYTDVRGLVTSDYQNLLEEQWVKKLNDKYKVEVDNDVLKTVKP